MAETVSLTAKNGDILRIIEDVFDGEVTTARLARYLDYGSTEAVKHHLRKLDTACLITLQGGNKQPDGTHSPYTATVTDIGREELQDGTIPGDGEAFRIEVMETRIEELEHENKELREQLQTVEQRLDNLEGNQDEETDNTHDDEEILW